MGVRHKSDSNFASPILLGTCAVNCCIAWQQMRTDANSYSFSYSREYSIDQTSALKLISFLSPPPPPPPAINPTPSPSPRPPSQYFSYIISQLNLDFTFINRRGATRWRVCTWYLNWKVWTRSTVQGLKMRVCRGGGWVVWKIGISALKTAKEGVSQRLK